MAAISAAEEKAPPLIIFKGHYFMEQWNPAEAYDGTTLAKSENGWMTTSIFYSWLEKLTQTFTQRPMLLVFDGHTTYVL